MLAQLLLTGDSICCCCSGWCHGHLPVLADPYQTRHIATFFSRKAVTVSKNTPSGYVVCCELRETCSRYVKSAKGSKNFFHWLPGFVLLTFQIKKHMEELLYPLLSLIQKSIVFWKIPRLHVFVLLVIGILWCRRVHSNDEILLTEANWSHRRQTCSSGTSFTTNVMWTGPGLYSCLYRKKMEYNSMSCGIGFKPQIL